MSDLIEEARQWINGGKGQSVHLGEELMGRLLDHIELQEEYGATQQTQIESLQRSNERLKAQRMASIEYGANLQRLIERFCAGRMDTLDRSDTPHHYDMLSKAAAITPEMRERIEEVLRRTDEGYAYDLRKSGTLRGILHDLLKETVEPALEGEQ